MHDDKRIHYMKLLSSNAGWSGPSFSAALEDEDGMTDEDSVMLARRPRARWRRRRGHIFVSAWRYWTRAMKGERESTAKPRLSLAKLQCSSEIWRVRTFALCQIVCHNIPLTMHRPPFGYCKDVLCSPMSLIFTVGKTVYSCQKSGHLNQIMKTMKKS